MKNTTITIDPKFIDTQLLAESITESINKDTEETEEKLSEDDMVDMLRNASSGVGKKVTVNTHRAGN